MVRMSPVEGNFGQRDEKPRWGCLLAIVAAVILSIFVSYQISPADWVELTLGPLPVETERFCVIAEDSQGVRTLPWYHFMVLPVADNPIRSGTLYGEGRVSSDGFTTTSIQWREARRYGILIRRKDDQWRLFWLEPREVKRPSVLRYFVGNNNDAALNLPDETRAEVPTPQFLERLGISPKE